MVSGAFTLRSFDTTFFPTQIKRLFSFLETAVGWLGLARWTLEPKSHVFHAWQRSPLLYER